MVDLEALKLTLVNLELRNHKKPTNLITKRIRIGKAPKATENLAYFMLIARRSSGLG